MARAKKQPSGMWKCRVYSHTDEQGKKHYRAFTAATKAEAEQEAGKFSGSLKRAERVDLTVSEAIAGYIKAKEGVLSPSTIRGYRRMERNNFKGISRIKIRKLTNERVQLFVSDLAKEMSAKSVKNIYGLLTASVALYLPDVTFRVTLPVIAKKKVSAPTDEQVKTLFRTATGWLKICVGLGAYAGLRRGEIAALKYGDIQDGMIHIHADMVQDSKGKYHYKEIPKTTDSIRSVPLQPEVAEIIGEGDPNAFIIDRYTGSITAMFEDLRDSLGFTDIRFHDLRAYYATKCAYAGAIDLYTAMTGGWSKSSGTMKRYYQREMDEMTEKYAAIIISHFSDILSKNI